MQIKDSLGNILTKEQEQYFQSSKVRDINGNLLVCFHGSDASFSSFDLEYASVDSKLGLGFYFTKGDSLQFDYDNVYECYLNIQKPLYEYQDSEKLEQVLQEEEKLLDEGKTKNEIMSEIISKFDIDGIIGDDRGHKVVVAFSPSQIKLITNTNPTSSKSINEELLVEKNRQELITKSKSGKEYSKKNQAKGKNRWERRRYSQLANSVRDYNDINMDAFWKGDILDFKIKIHGETDDYIVSITFERILEELQREVKANNNKLEFKCVLRALLKAFNGEDVYMDCSCLHPNTKIKLLDGTTPTVEEMKNRFDAGEKLYVYSTDSNGDFKPGEVEKVWITKHTKDFIKVTLDNGQEILTTPDHLYMLRNGTYKLAEDLKEGQSLMPMYFNSSNGYETVKFNSKERGWYSVYKLVANYFKQIEIDETKLRVKPEDNMSYDVAIHHRDFNKRNNNPENLQVMTAKEHWNYHASLCGENKPITNRMREVARENAYKRNANPTKAMLKSRKEWQEKGRLRNYDDDRKQQQAEVMRSWRENYYNNLSEDEKRQHSEILSKSTKKLWSRGCFNTEEFRMASIQRGKDMHSPEREKLTHAGILNYWKNISLREKEKRDEISRNNAKKGALTLISKILQIMIDNKEDLSITNYEKHRKETKRIGYPKIETHFKSIEEAISYFKLNHRVVKVERIVLNDTPVYDIKVKDWHNFVVEAGVVLHNCPDFKYRFAYHATMDRYNAGKPELRPNRFTWTNSEDDMGAGCKHTNLVLSNTDWMMKVASVINNYIKWTKDNMGRNYADYIFPKVYGMPYDRAVQLSLFDDPEDNGLLPSDQETLTKVIDKSLQGRDERGRFNSENEFKFQKKDVNQKYPEDNPNQIKLDFEKEQNKRFKQPEDDEIEVETEEEKVRNDRYQQ